MTPLEEALDIAQRCVKFRLFGSMNELRKMVRTALKARGLEDQLRNFKLKSAGPHEVYVFVRPNLAQEVRIVDYE